MKKLFKTSELGFGRDKHYHIAYINSDKGLGVTSFDKGHSHEVFFKDEVLEQKDEQGNIISPYERPQWLVLPAEDGHLHNLVEYQRQPFKKKEDDETLVEETLSLASEAWDLESQSREDGEEAEKFFMGEHWEEVERQRLFRDDRAALTINEIEPIVHELCGYEKDQRTDIQLLAQEGGDQRAADMYNHVTKHVLEQCYYDREKSQIFEDGVIVGRGLYNLFVDFSRTIEGEIRVERYPWDRAAFGPHDKIDASDAEYLVKDKMLSLGKLKQLVPGKADELTAHYDDMLEVSSTSRGGSGPSDKYSIGAKYQLSAGGRVLVDIQRKEYRLIEVQRRIYEKFSVIAHAEDEYYYNAWGWNKKDVERARTIPGFRVVERVQPLLRITKLAGGVLLSDDYPADVPGGEFTLVPYYAKRRRGKFWGKVKALIDPQREINKRHSQATDIGNKMATWGWFYEPTMFPPGGKEKFKKNANKPGFFQEVNDVNRTPKEVQGSRFPSELVELMQVSSEKLTRLANVQVGPRGANTSGDALLQEQRQRLIGNEYLFDNLVFAEVQVVRLLVQLIQKYWSPDRVLRLIESKNQRTPVTVGGQSLDAWSRGELENILQTADVMTYDLVVSQSSKSPSAQVATYTVLTGMAQKGMSIPPELIVEVSPIPESSKQRILEGIETQNQVQGQAQSEASRAEVEKTLIAKGIIPPKIQEEYAIDAQGNPRPQQQQADINQEAGGEAVPVDPLSG